MASEATELIRMARSLLNLPMSNLTQSEMVKQHTIHMSDGSEIVYNIDITLQTRNDHSIAAQKIEDAGKNLMQPIELLLVRSLSDCPDDDTPDGGADDMLTADDYPECAE